MIILKKGIFIKKFGAALLITTLAFNFTSANAYSASKAFLHSNNMTCKSNAQAFSKPEVYSSPRVKDKYQLINGPCWAFANIATLETFLSKKGILKESLSEKHLLSYANQSSCASGFHYPIAHGGNNMAASGYFSSGMGPVFESECPYSINDICFNPALAAIKPKYWVKGIKHIATDIKSIQSAIFEYGAVTIIYPVKSNLYHAVSAIGFDPKAREWLVKDSAKRQGNYTRLPYSTKILEACCITNAEIFPYNIKIYQHDNFGVTGNCSANSKLIVANVFDFDGNETLDQVTVCSAASNAKIDVFLAPVSTNNTPTNCKTFWRNLYSGTVPYKGYFTLNLNNKIRLDKNKYAIIVQIEKTNMSETPSIGYQSPCDHLTLSSSQPGKSFILYGSNFLEAKNILNLKNMSGFSIKAITKK